MIGTNPQGSCSLLRYLSHASASFPSRVDMTSTSPCMNAGMPWPFSVSSTILQELVFLQRTAMSPNPTERSSPVLVSTMR